jgi:hypothetical protein
MINYTRIYAVLDDILELGNVISGPSGVERVHKELLCNLMMDVNSLLATSCNRSVGTLVESKCIPVGKAPLN